MKPTQNGAFTLRAIVALTLLLVFLSFYETSAHANIVSNEGKPAVSHPVAVQPALDGSGSSAEMIKRGEYLAKVADCVSCHTDLANRGKPFAGGREMKTPFGLLYTPNITPDEETGIGKWSDEDFVRAVREGIRSDGSYYYPVFPYNYFNAMSRDEVLAIKAYLGSIPPVKKKNQEQQMNWPWGMRFLQFGWRMLYFDFQEHGFEKDPQKSAEWNRGAFIVNGPGHCVMCHTELNIFGVPKEEYLLTGAFVDGYFAPDISSHGLKHLKREEVAAIFEQDKMPTGAKLGGPMAEVEHNSLRYLTHHDALAIAEFLKSVQSKSPPIEDVGGDPLDETEGKRLYQSNCSICHAYGTGAPNVSDQLAWEHLLDQGKDRLYEVAIKGDGPMPAKGNCQQCSDERIKATVDYMLKLALHKASGTQETAEAVKVLEPTKPPGVPNVVRDPHDVPAPIHR
jgi:cytochrome c5